MSDETITRGERTRAEILQAAYNLFVFKGYHGTSMRQIASEAGVALGSIYNHFPGKDEIFKTVLLERHPYFEVLPLINAAEGANVDEFVRDAARRLVDGLGQRTDFLNLMFIELVEFNGQHVPILFQELFPQILVFVQRFVDAKDELRSIPAPMLVRAFVGLFFSYVMTEFLVGYKFPSEMHVGALDTFVDIYLYGILKNGPMLPQEVK